MTRNYITICNIEYLITLCDQCGQPIGKPDLPNDEWEHIRLMRDVRKGRSGVVPHVTEWPGHSALPTMEDEDNG